MTTSTQPLTDPGSCQTREMIVRVSEAGQAVVVRLEGEVRVLEVPRLQVPLMQLVARKVPLVVLDLADLTFISSLAIGALVGLRRDLGRFGGRVRMAGVRPAVAEVLESTRVGTLFASYATVEEAVAAG
jgi:anti-sigma B factor antagonist